MLSKSSITMSDVNQVTMPDDEALRAERAELEAQAIQAQTTIERLAQSVDAERLFTTVTACLAIGRPEDYSEATHGTIPAKVELLAYYLYSFFGTSKNDVTPSHTIECLNALESLFSANLLVSSLSELSNSNPVDEIKHDVQRQFKIVRGTAYPEQTTAEIVEIQGRFENWFTRKVGVGPVRAQSLLWAIRRAQQRSVINFMPRVQEIAETTRAEWLEAKRTAKKRRTLDHHKTLSTLRSEEFAWLTGRLTAMGQYAPQYLPVAREDITDVTPPPTKEEWHLLTELLGLTTSNRLTLKEVIDVRQKPLFILSDDRVVFVDVPNVFDVLWDRFEQIAKKDVRLYERYQKQRGRWLEESTGKSIGKIFPATHIFQNLSYPDPYKNDGSTTELDGAIIWGPFLILIENKAKQFRLESQLGDVGRLITDLKENVQEAFDQARRAAKYINDTPNPTFIETETKRQLIIDKKKIKRIYLITVSQHHLAGLATRLASLRDLGMFKDAEYPLSISAADLDTVTEFCEGPDVFLHYVEKRLTTQQLVANLLADELDFFGAYLDTRLQPDRFLKRGKKEYDFIWLSGFSESFDAWSLYKKGELPAPPTIRLDVPAEIRRVLVELRARDDDNSRWIAFSLLDMSDEELELIDAAIRELRGAEFTPGMLRRLTHVVGETVISVVGSEDVSIPELVRRTGKITEVEKYRYQKTKSIGFGIFAPDQSKPYETAILIEGPWRYEKQLEDALKSEPLRLPAPSQKLPGRNEPCICGSNKKFKKCCQEQFTRMRA